VRRHGTRPAWGPELEKKDLSEVLVHPCGLTRTWSRGSTCHIASHGELENSAPAAARRRRGGLRGERPPAAVPGPGLSSWRPGLPGPGLRLGVNPGWFKYYVTSVRSHSVGRVA
jgi:hypothetical protein